MFLKAFLKRIDLFGQSIQFNYKNKAHYPTLCGGSLTIIIVTFLFIYFILILNDIICKRYPEVISSVIPSTSALNISFSINNQIPYNPFSSDLYRYSTSDNDISHIQFSIGFLDSSLKIYKDIDPSLFSLHAEETKITNSSINTRRLFFTKCRSFLNINSPLDSFHNISSTYCIYDNVNVGGVLPYSIKYVNISIRKCVNNTLKYDTIPYNSVNSYSGARVKEDLALYFRTDNQSVYPYVSPINIKESLSSPLLVKCRPNEEIENLIKTMKIHLLSSRSTFNFTNPYQPVNNLLHKREYELMKSIKTNVDFYLGKSTLTIYDGVLPKSLQDSKKLFNSLTISTENVFYEEIEQSNQDIFTLYLKSSNNINKNEIKYKDIFYAIGIVGGLSKVMIFIGSIIALYISKLKFKESLINEFYSVIDPKNNKFISRSFKEFLECKYEQYSFAKGNSQLSKYNDDNLENALNRFFSKEIIRKIYIYEKTKEMEYSIYKEKYLYEFEKHENIGKDEDLLDHLGFNRYAIVYEVFKNDVYSKLNYSVLEIVSLIFCRCCLPEKLSKKRELFDKACHKLAQDTDFISIVKSIFQFETVKKVFLDEDQLNLFNSVSNKPITIEEVHNVENIKDDLKEIIKKRKEENTTKNLTQDQVQRNLRKIKRCQKKIRYLNFKEDDEENLEEEEEVKEEKIKRLDISLGELILNEGRNEFETDTQILKKLKVNDKYSKLANNNYLEEFLQALRIRRKESAEKNESPKKNRKSTLKNYEINADYFWNKFSGKKQIFM